MKSDIKNNNINILEKFAEFKQPIIEIIRKLTGKINIKPAENKRKIEINEKIYLSDDFKQLWNKIKYKTTYSVNFETDNLIDKCSKAIRNKLDIPDAKLVYTKASTNIDVSGIKVNETERTTVKIDYYKDNLPDIITYLQNQTNLTRKTIVEVLVKSKTLDLFKKNPQKYMQDVVKIISSEMNLMLVDGIKYTKLGEDEYYSMELFKNNELFGYIDNNIIESSKTPFEYTIYDSQNEETFINAFENNSSIKLYTKLPSWFKIPTPIGFYNPDWAIIIDECGETKLYFVLETKANMSEGSLRPTESGKIKCGEKHFEIFKNDIEFKASDNFKNFIENIK